MIIVGDHLVFLLHSASVSQHLGFVQGDLFTLYHGKSPIKAPCFSHHVFYFFTAFLLKMQIQNTNNRPVSTHQKHTKHSENGVR